MATQKSALRGALTSTRPSSANTPIASAGATGEGKGEEPLTPYSQALSRLEPLQPVLAGLAHRNHNQHRRAAWWRCFGMLRRNCARFVEELVSAVAAARKDAAKAAKAAKAKSKKRRREELASGERATPMGGKDGLSVAGTDADMERDENVARHAIWLRDVLVPKCYLAFSQLTADNQFAPLGVVLLGILAQVQAACDCATPRPATHLPESPFIGDIPAAPGLKSSNVESTVTFPKVGDTTVLPALALEPQFNGAKRTLERNEEVRGGNGEGKAISREAVERAAELRKKGKAAGNVSLKARPEKDIKPANSPAPPEVPKTTSSVSSSKIQVLSTPDSGADEAARPSKKIKTAPESKERAKGKGTDSNAKDKKKKKKAKKGDEFDDLFKGLF
ncbi:hypothetical protein F5Y10DRAFT_52114 [Nemania abortiva]|nr:hypothetical protein F5Y10DRAFT_52114 [Nemania abortiva]